MVGPAVGAILGGGSIASPWGEGELVISESGLHLCDVSTENMVTVTWADFRREQIELGRADGPSTLTIMLAGESIAFTLAPTLAAAAIGASGRHWFCRPGSGELDVELFEAERPRRSSPEGEPRRQPPAVGLATTLAPPELLSDGDGAIVLDLAPIDAVDSAASGSSLLRTSTEARLQPSTWATVGTLATGIIVAAAAVGSALALNDPPGVALSSDISPATGPPVAASPGLDDRGDGIGEKGAAGALDEPILSSTTSTMGPAPPSSGVPPPATRPSSTSAAPSTTVPKPPDGTTIPSSAPASSMVTTRPRAAKQAAPETADHQPIDPPVGPTTVAEMLPSEPVATPTVATPPTTTAVTSASVTLATSENGCHPSYRACLPIVGEVICLVETLADGVPHLAGTTIIADDVGDGLDASDGAEDCEIS